MEDFWVLMARLDQEQQEFKHAFKEEASIWFRHGKYDEITCNKKRCVIGG